ncbi:hypothetical protein QQ008_01120 [Fulvivirgaceae bacterium BMA10]|uniref:RelA/SpoT domain-containing protein n=1 Tax=Splendidivirga corallicola TaxID=3051826 RepID=A0ABT8KGU1_9BACT|nr:hypothetical protein [Fulvivirgaceae bacterium BMA10]
MDKIEEFVSEFEGKRPFYKRFTGKIQVLIEELLIGEGIKLHTIETRTKEVDSFREKITRNGYKEPFKEMTDLSGIRIITYYQDDQDKIIECIKSEFKIDEKNSEDKRNKLKPHEFGYLSVHLIVELDDRRKRLAEWKNFKGYKAEIQIRTVLQHSWASISHALEYKTKHDVPTGLKRKLYRLAGLIELADEEFLQMKIKHDELGKNLQQKDILPSETEINFLSIQQYLEKSELLKELVEVALSAGFVDEPPNYVPTGNDVSALVSIIAFLRVRFINELDEILKKNSSISFKFFEKLLEKNRWRANNTVVLAIVLLYEFRLKQDKIQTFVDLTGWHIVVINTILETANEIGSKN